VTIGSLYDARNDSIVGKLDGNIQSKKEKIKEKASSVMYKRENIQRENLLKILRIDDETCLTTRIKAY
jgi:hypothetical protein